VELVERDALLARLDERLQAVAHGGGHVVLVSGEAGIGKTSLLKAFAARRGGAALWWGACDSLETPHPLAPLHDIARAGEPALRPWLEAGRPRAELFEAVLGALQRSAVPVVAVFEDVHWADDATLDLLKFLGRRIDRVPCLLVLSHRDDEVGAGHPLRGLLGQLPASLVTRVEPRPLSAEAVARLARAAMRSAGDLHALTRGNPLFVSELLRHGTDGVPHGVQDLVLARYARLGPQAQALVRLASTVPARIEAALVQAVLDPPAAAIDECLNSGLLGALDGAYAFRHELVRCTAACCARWTRPACPRCRWRAACTTLSARATPPPSSPSPPRPRARPRCAARTARPPPTCAARSRSVRTVPSAAPGSPRMPSNAVSPASWTKPWPRIASCRTGTAATPTRCARPTT
jgi:hypothetical protein